MSRPAPPLPPPLSPWEGTAAPFVRTMARNLVRWRGRLGLAAGTALLFLLPATGFSQLLLGNVPGFFTADQEARLQAATNPAFTPGQRAFLDLLQFANEVYWLVNERLEITRFLRSHPDAQGAAPFRRFRRTERLEREFLFQALLALRQASPFQVAFFLDDDPGQLTQGRGFFDVLSDQNLNRGQSLLPPEPLPGLGEP